MPTVSLGKSIPALIWGLKNHMYKALEDPLPLVYKIERMKTIQLVDLETAL